MQQKISKQITYWLGVVAIGLIVGIGIQFVQAGWVAPTLPPTDAAGMFAPLNTGNIGQGKDAGLVLNPALTENGLVVRPTYTAGVLTGAALIEKGGNVGIGTVNPSNGTGGQLKLDVDGSIGAKKYCDESGNNCVGSSGEGLKIETTTIRSRLLPSTAEKNNHCQTWGKYKTVCDTDSGLVSDGPPAWCAAGWVRTGCTVSCNGAFNENDFHVVTGIDNDGKYIEGCNLSNNDKCIGSNPTINVYAICARIKP